MKNEFFYVYPEIGHGKGDNITPDKSRWIAAKFLHVNGAPVVDPNPQQVNLYTKLDSTGRIDESSHFKNPAN